jgi:hypothetical protein
VDKRVLDCLKTEIDRTGAAKILYKLTGPNSNSVVYTLLVKCEIPAQKPVIVHLVGDRLYDFIIFGSHKAGL